MQAMRALRSHGISLEEIEQAVRKTTGISEKKLNELLDDVVNRNQQYYTEVIDLAKVTAPETLLDAAVADAIRAQTLDTFRKMCIRDSAWSRRKKHEPRGKMAFGLI